jgi:hypothetical protein
VKSAGSISDPARGLTMLPWWYSSIFVYLGRYLHRLGVELLISVARLVRKNCLKPSAVSVPWICRKVRDEPCPHLALADVFSKQLRIWRSLKEAFLHT